MTETSINPAIFTWDGPHGLPRFEAVKDEDFKAAFDFALAAHEAEIEAIAGNPEPPAFANTIAALEIAGDELSRVSALFWNKAGADTNETIQHLERAISPVMSRHYSKIGQNEALFRRIDALWQARENLGLTPEEMRVLERHWKGFVKSGARLPRAEQRRLAEINEKLSSLGTGFGQNVLADEKNWFLPLSSEEELAGLPGFLRDAMAAAAEARGEAGKYAVTLSRSIIEPFLTFSDRRDLREQAFNAWIARGENPGPTDNREIIAETVSLRAEKATLLGYPHYAALKLDNTMAKSAGNVNTLLMQV